MSIFDSIYLKSFGSKNNRLLIYVSLFSSFFTIAFFFVLFIFKFEEVYKSRGLVVPLYEDNVSIKYDGYLDENLIKIGKRFSRGDELLKINKDEIMRSILDLKKELNLKSNKVKVYKNFYSKIERDEVYFEIESIKTKIEKYYDEMKEQFVLAPYDCIIVSSDIKYQKSGFIPKGSVVCKIISSDSPLIKTTIDTEMIGKILKNQKCLIRVKKKRMEIKGVVDNIELSNKDDSYFQDIYIKVADEISLSIGMEVEVQIIMAELSVKDFLLEIFDLY